MTNYYNSNRRFIDISIRRLAFLSFCLVVCGGIIIFRLFFLQVIEHSELVTWAKAQRTSGIKIPARRGEILARDPHTGNYFKLATNITLDLLYVDPQETPDKPYVAKLLASYVFTEEDFLQCHENIKFCPKLDFNTLDPLPNDQELIEINLQEITYPTYLVAIEKDILQKISQTEISFMLLQRNVSDEILTKINRLHIYGIYAEMEDKYIYANPSQLPEDEVDVDKIAKSLSNILVLPQPDIKQKLLTKKLRYVFLKRKLLPEQSEKLKELITSSYKERPNKKKNEHRLKGIVLHPEHWRFYPNENLASSILGFYNNEFGGQYGLEETFDSELIGKKGEIIADTDPWGNPISFTDQDISNVINGQSFVLTIDIAIQKKVEEILERNVKKFKAVSGQIIILNPFTGAITAMANYPSFNPNDYSSVYEKEKIGKWEKVPDYIPVFVKENDTLREAKKGERDNFELDRYIYKNRIGSEAFRNKAIQDIYEPGSVFKPITMAIALDRDEVTPQSRYLDTGEFKTNEYIGDKEIIIRNANHKKYGWVTMTECLNQSINTCLSYVATKLGRKFYAPLFYNYIRDFGFGEFTDIELINEERGKVDFYDKWTETQLVNTSFGQGLAATPLQVVTAWAALANGGILIKPYIIDKVLDTNGNVKQTETKIVERAINQETSNTITAMLVSSINNGVAQTAQLPTHQLAGKTGTSQIAKTNGRGYEKGEGSYYTTFAGYGPVDHPKFVMLVKFDRSRYGDSTWGSTTAAPTFREIAKFLMDYYNIPPDKTS